MKARSTNQIEDPDDRDLHRPTVRHGHLFDPMASWEPERKAAYLKARDDKQAAANENRAFGVAQTAADRFDEAHS